MVARWLTRPDPPPDAFAIVMATGIVSVAASDHGYRVIANVLAAFAVTAFVLLAFGLTVRVMARPRSALAEVADPDVALRLFTCSAACSVLGARFAGTTWAVGVFGALALAAWLVLVAVAWRDVSSRRRAYLRDHAHGAWLLPSVATAGLVITAADLAIDGRVGVFLPVAAVAWLLALVIYAAVTWFIAWRALAAPFVPEAVTPDSWILMGALAIVTLAGAHLAAATSTLHASGYGWVQPATLAVWVGAALWIPVLLYAEVWSLERRPAGLRYTQVWWSAVFPLGMFSAATAAMSALLGIRSLATVSLVFFWVALTVWLLVATGLARAWLARGSAPRRARDRSGAHRGRTGAIR